MDVKGIHVLYIICVSLFSAFSFNIIFSQRLFHCVSPCPSCSLLKEKKSCSMVLIDGVSET